MPKSARKKKASRQRRDDAAAVELRRRERAAMAAEAERRVTALLDPLTAPAEVAESVLFLYGADAVPTRELAGTLATSGGLDRLLEITAAVEARAPGSLLSTVFAAECGRTAGDRGVEIAALSRAVAAADSPRTAAAVARLCLDFRAVDLAEQVLAPWLDDLTENPVPTGPAWEDEDADDIRDAYAALARAALQAGERPDIVEAFLDRSRVYEVMHVVARWTDLHPTWARAVDDALPRETVDRAGLIDVDLTPEFPMLFTEHAWLVANPERAAEGAETDDPVTLLDRAAEVAEDARLALLMRSWPSTVQYGLWQVVDSTSEPDLEVMEIVTGARHRVAMSQDHVAGLPRWSVLLGALVADGPVWRTTAKVVRLSPDEADALVPMLDDIFDLLARALDRGRSLPPRPRDPAPLAAPGQAEPAGVLAGAEEPAPPEICYLMSRVVGSSLDRIANAVIGWRQERPQIVNMDGHPVVQLSVRIRVDDPAAVTRAFAQHDDFSAGDGRGEWTWWARALTRAEREQSLAEVRATQPDLELIDDDEPQRWVRGMIVVRRNELHVELNSQERLDMLIDLLRAVGSEPVIVERVSVDPHLDMVLPTIFEAGRQLSPEGHAAWVRTWVDESVPALGGMTPREAAEDDEMSQYLEALLRMFEWRADRAAAQSGSEPADFDMLRELLDMPRWQFL